MRDADEIDDSIRWDVCPQHGSETELDEFQLPWVMRICAWRDTGSVVSRDIEQVNIKVLSIGITVNFQRLIEPGGLPNPSCQIAVLLHPFVLPMRF